MRILAGLLLPVFLLSGLALGAFEDQSLVFRADFDQPDSFGSWRSTEGHIVRGYEGTPSLLIENGDVSARVNRQIQIPADRIDGRLIAIPDVVKSGKTKVIRGAR